MSVIYKIIGPTGMIYVGATSQSLSSRKAAHKYAALKLKLKNPLYEAIRQHGFDFFRFEIIESCSHNKKWEREMFWIKELKAFGEGYNQSTGGRGCNNFRLPEDRKKRMSKCSKKMWADPVMREKLTKAREHIFKDFKMQSYKGRLGAYAKAANQPWFDVFNKKTNSLIGSFQTARSLAEKLGVSETQASRYLRGKTKVGNELYQFIWK